MLRLLLPGRTMPREVIVLSALALAGCVAGEALVDPAPVIELPLVQAVPTEDEPVIEELSAADAAMKEIDELLAKLKDYRLGPPIWGEPDDGKYHDVETAVRTATRLLAKLKEAYEAAPDDGERIAQKALEAASFLRAMVMANANADDEDRRAVHRVWRLLRRFHIITAKGNW